MATTPPNDPNTSPWGDTTIVDATAIENTEAGPVYLGKHRICYELASGGMGTVYLARTEGPGGFEKPVAIKTIRPEFAADPRLVEMFLREARIASQISHPNVCPVFDFGEQDGTYYIAMEYLVGEPLSQVMNRLARDPALRKGARRYVFAAKLVADACEGLHAAHELLGASGQRLGIVHRDISPHNIFVTYDGSVRVMDFGIARATHELTGTGTIRGRLGFLAPEQLRQSAAVDHRADVWALGVVLWELITLERLFDATDPGQAIERILGTPIRAPSSVAREAPAEFDRAVLKALEQEPERRFASARDMARELTESLGRHPPPVALAEIADWMAQVFPEGQRRRRQLVDSVTTSNPAHTSGTVTLPSATEVQPVAQTARRAHARRLRNWAMIGLAAVGVSAVVAIATSRQVHAPETASGPASVLPSRAPRGTARTPALRPQASAPVARDPGATRTDALPTTPSLSTSPAVPVARDVSRSLGAPTRPRRSLPLAGGRPMTTSGIGRVAVVTPGGWATVSRGGSRLGQSPLTFALPTGTHRLTLRPFDGAATQTVTVVVRKDELARVVVPIGRTRSR